MFKTFFNTILLSLTVVSVFAQLKVLDYNSMHGFEGDSLAKAKYINWIKQVNPDVIMYQEMAGFSNKQLQEFARKYNHSYTVMISEENGYDVTHPIAFTSKLPFEFVERNNKDMWHSYVLVKVRGFYLMATHLAPFTLKDKQHDVDLILKRVKSLPANTPVLIGGDFNSLARFDSAQYGDKLLKSMQKIEGRLEPKSGTSIVKNRIIYRNNLNNGQIDYSVTDKMMEAGFVDAYYHLYKSFKNSVPVKSRLKKSSVLRRTDYVWLNPQAIKSLVFADVLQNEITDVISDHYPVLVQFSSK